MSTSVLLRTLTKKSQLKFGKYADLTVDQVITLYGAQGLRYLDWVYYNCSNISFCDELLSELAITGDFKIIKPGKIDSELGNKFRLEITSKRLNVGTIAERKLANKLCLSQQQSKVRRGETVDRLFTNPSRLMNNNRK